MLLYQLVFNDFHRRGTPREPSIEKKLPGRRVVNSRKLTGKVVKRAETNQERFTYLESAR